MSSSKNDTELAQQYQQKTDKQHILDNPDTYIGSVENVDANLWVYNEQTKRIELREIEYIPGLYKLFDEGIVNCRDHFVRLQQKLLKKEKKIIPVRNIEITVDRETGVITMMNDGNGVDAGHVRIYENTGGTWSQIGQDIDGEAADDWLGYGSTSVSLSSDGNILATGARYNDGPDGTNNGHVRVFGLSPNLA